MQHKRVDCICHLLLIVFVDVVKCNVELDRCDRLKFLIRLMVQKTSDLRLETTRQCSFCQVCFEWFD